MNIPSRLISPAQLSSADHYITQATLTAVLFIAMDSSSNNHGGDFLEESVLLDESQYQEGYKDGYNDGLLSGKQEGSEVGLKAGFQLGEELGFYQGCVDVWNSVIQSIDPEAAFTPRVRKNIAQLEKLLDSFPLMDPENDNAQEILLDSIRLRFRMVCANLRVKLDYQGQPTSLSKDSHEDM